MRDDAANDEKSGCGERRVGRERGDGGDVSRLIALRGFRDDEAGSVWNEARVEEPVRDIGVVWTGHVNNNCSIGSDGESSQETSIGGAGESGEEHVRGDAAIGERDLRGGSSTESGGDARNNFESDFGGA